MSDNLRVKLGKSTVENKQKSDFPWHGVWAEAMAAYNSGWTKPEGRMPILIDASTPIPTPEKLQELADLPSVPEVMETTKTNPYSDEYDENLESQKVRICDISLSQFYKLRERVECDRYDICVWFENGKRFAAVALSLKVETEEREEREKEVGKSVSETTKEAS
ncbi:hypothetical protein QBC33DRAFT_532687 [Phialemonium atrogriseum]|uniref:Uncharacterized protein n=1 Tax=Phialemonium atrogriseum TaxID=1093897 RepID=A0AAJ0FNP8_9PEZI|nr:uncharacterized protein QBC33DRAFT_532687 [Phialemonium atrogriseum]KAK1769229.1 hypothetical protein QBC33DRAFT_532687 [Phialemonium atrogriseum]